MKGQVDDSDQNCKRRNWPWTNTWGMGKGKKKGFLISYTYTKSILHS